MGVHWKIQFLGGGGGQEKPIYRGEVCLIKGGAWTVCRSKGGLTRMREGGVFEGGGVDTPMQAML